MNDSRHLSKIFITTVDIFDPVNFCKPQNFAAAPATEQISLKNSVRNSPQERFIQAHLNPEYWFQTQKIELKENGEFHLIANDLSDSLKEKTNYRPKHVVPDVICQGILFLWPIGMLDITGRSDPSNTSAWDPADTHCGGENIGLVVAGCPGTNGGRNDRH